MTSKRYKKLPDKNSNLEAETVEKFLMENKLQNDGENTPIEAFFVTDFPQKFDELGSQFLGRTLTNVHYIKL